MGRIASYMHACTTGPPGIPDGQTDCNKPGGCHTFISFCFIWPNFWVQNSPAMSGTTTSPFSAAVAFDWWFIDPLHEDNKRWTDWNLKRAFILLTQSTHDQLFIAYGWLFFFWKRIFKSDLFDLPETNAVKWGLNCLLAISFHHGGTKAAFPHWWKCRK